MQQTTCFLFLKRHSIWVLLGLTLAVFFYIHSAYHIRFETNDDPAMALIASGAYSGSPDNHLVFINMLYGSFLNALYFMLPNHEWYTLCFIGINIFSITLIAWKIIGTSHTRLTKLVFLLFIYSAFFSLSLQLQFTRTAAIAAVAGIILLSDADQKNRYLGSFLFILASLIRFEAAFLVLLISGPIFLRDYLQAGKIRINKGTIILIATVAISAGCKGVDYVYYQSNPEWSYFSKYNAARGEIHGASNARLLIRDLPEGISKTDYKLLLYFHPDPGVVDYAALLRVKAKMSEMPAATKRRPIAQLRKHQTSLWLFLVITLACACHRPWKKPMSITVIMMMMIMMATLVYISMHDSPKDRVFFAVLVAFISPLPFLLNSTLSRTQQYTVLLSVFLLSWIINKQSSAIIKNHPENALVYEDNAKLVDRYLSDPKNKIRFYLADFKSEYQDPFAISSNFQTGWIAGSGWATNIPFDLDEFSSFNDYIDGYGLLVSKKRYPSAVGLISESILLNHRKKVEPHIVAECDNSVIVEFTMAGD